MIQWNWSETINEGDIIIQMVKWSMFQNLVQKKASFDMLPTASIWSTCKAPCMCVCVCVCLCVIRTVVRHCIHVCVCVCACCMYDTCKGRGVFTVYQLYPSGFLCWVQSTDLHVRNPWIALCKAWIHALYNDAWITWVIHGLHI